MVKQEGLLLSEGAPWCKGTKGELADPVQATVSKFLGRTKVDCPLLQKSTSECKQGGRCLWIPIYDAREHQSTELRCITPAGEFVHDPAIRAVLQSPLLESGHDPVALARAESIIVESFMREQGRYFSQEEIQEMIDSKALGQSRVADILIARIRKKIGQTKESPQPIIDNRRGEGYGIPFPPIDRRRRTA